MTTDVDAAARFPISSAGFCCAAILALAAVAFVVLRAPFVSVPLERDEGEYAYAGQLILHGIPPYHDC